MTVRELIEKLNTFPMDLQVMYDSTNYESDMFKLVSIDACEEIETDSGVQLILLETMSEDNFNEN